MINIKKHIALFTMLISICTYAITDIYDMTISLKVPSIYNNGESLGSRKLQTQKLRGNLHVVYTEGQPELILKNVINLTHVVSTGKNVTYTCFSGKTTDRFNYIGDNRKNTFKTPSMIMQVILHPSYAVADPNEDNSMILNLSGYGTSSMKKIKNANIPITLQGYATGQLGCGCSDYGHISPTRVIGPVGFQEIIDDIAPVYGTWKMKFLKRLD